MNNQIAIYCGDCRLLLAQPPLDGENWVDAIVTDPPYELGFMGKKWDSSGISYDVEMWRKCLRALKPGGHLLSFGGSRTYHRMACAIEDAGFEIRDQIMWIYGSGFPKSLDVSKAIDKAAGAEREVVGSKLGRPGYSLAENDTDCHQRKDYGLYQNAESECSITAPATDAAKQWQGWGTALKPAHEPICVARKPIEGTVAANVLKHGTGALNIDRCRVAQGENDKPGHWTHKREIGDGNIFQGGGRTEQDFGSVNPASGRWPANVIHDGSEEVVSLFPQSSITGDRSSQSKSAPVAGTNWLSENHESTEYTDSGSAARFFYCAKTSKSEREAGCEDLALVPLAYGNQAQAEVKRGNTEHSGNSGINTVKMRGNNHPTVKPLALMRYLCQLVTPPGGTIIDPFCGSGTTALAARSLGFRFVGIEEKEEYCRIAMARLKEPAK